MRKLLQKTPARPNQKRTGLTSRATRQLHKIVSGLHQRHAEAEVEHGDKIGRVQKGQANGRIIESFNDGEREYSLHATKGWRTRKL